MTQQDIAMGMMRFFIIAIFGLAALTNFYYMFSETDSNYSPPVRLIGFAVDLIIIYFAWTL